jgi:glycosyltransferase 2 family protein
VIERSQRVRRTVRIVGYLALVAAIVTATIIGRDVVRDAWSSLGSISAAWWAALVVLCGLWTLLRAVVQRLSIASVDMRTVATMSEAGEAANWLPLGGLGSFALRTAIGRSAGIALSSLVVAMVLSTEALGTALWVLVAVAAVIDFRRGDADALDRAAIVGAALGISATAIGALVLLTSNRVTRWLIKRAVALQSWAARRWPRLEVRDLESTIEMARADGADLLRHRAFGFLGASVGIYLASGSILWAALRALGETMAWHNVLIVYMPVKAAVGFAPTPGGVGFTEAGLGGALVAAGVPLSQSVAAVACYRLFTALVPIISGSALGLWWLRRERRLSGLAPSA